LYTLIEYRKPIKHLEGAHNITVKRFGTFKLLIDAEKALYSAGKNSSAPNIGYRLDDTKYNVQREFYNPTNKMIYVKQPDERNEFGKRVFHSYTLSQYRNWITQKAKNPFTQVI